MGELGNLNGLPVADSPASVNMKAALGVFCLASKIDSVVDELCVPAGCLQSTAQQSL